MLLLKHNTLEKGQVRARWAGIGGDGLHSKIGR